PSSPTRRSPDLRPRQRPATSPGLQRHIARRNDVNNPPLSTQAFAIGQFLARIVSELRYLVVDDQDTERHFRDGLSRPSDGILTALQALYREMGDLDIEVRREIEARI